MRHVDPDQSYLALAPDLSKVIPADLRDPIEDFICVIARIVKAVPAARDGGVEGIVLPEGTVAGAKAAFADALKVFLNRTNKDQSDDLG